MLPFKFAIFYFHNEVVKVESTSLIVGNIGKFNQINSRPDLTDENWLELKCPSRKEPKKTEAVKVLLFGDSFKELIQKKNKFIIGGDIWPKDDMKPREANIGQDKKKKQKSTRQEARDKTLAKLKDTLSQKRSLQASEELFSSSDDCQTPVRKKRMRIQQFSPQPSSDDTDIGSPPPLQIIENLEESLHVNPETGTDAQDNAVPSMAEIIGCLRELPETLRLMKECVEKVNTSMSHTSSTNVSVSSTFSSDADGDGDSEVHFLPGKTVAVSKRAFLRLNRTRMTVFAQELAVLLFSKDTLAKSTLTGKYGKGEMAKGQLDVIKVQAITDGVIEEFPGSTVSEVRAAIRRKCNNEHFSHKRP